MPDWISTHEAAQMSGYHPDYIRMLIRAGTIRAEKKGNTWWVDQQSMLEFIATAEQQTDKRFGPKPRRKRS